MKRIRILELSLALTWELHIHGKTDLLTYSWITGVFINILFTYPALEFFKNGRVEIIPNDQGNRITPSYVAFTADGERLIGDAAKNQLTTNPENTIFDAKRLIGRDWTDESVHNDMKYFPFKVMIDQTKEIVSQN